MSPHDRQSNDKCTMINRIWWFESSFISGNDFAAQNQEQGNDKNYMKTTIRRKLYIVDLRIGKGKILNYDCTDSCTSKREAIVNFWFEYAHIISGHCHCLFTFFGKTKKKRLFKREGAVKANTYQIDISRVLDLLNGDAKWKHKTSKRELSLNFWYEYAHIICYPS